MAKNVETNNGPGNLSKFPTRGISNSKPENLSGAPSKSTTPVSRKSTASGGPTGTKANRPAVLERNGFKGAPQTTMSYPNAPEASGNTFRQVKLVKSALGNRDFWDARQNLPQGSPIVAPGFPGGSWSPTNKA